MTKRILLFSRDPGGANTIIPLVEPLKGRGYEVLLYGKDTALLKYDKYGLVGTDIETVLSDISLEKITLFLEQQKPDFIITGTSADDFTEKFLWKAAEKLGIRTFAIIDQWINYKVRFSDYTVAEICNHLVKTEMTYLPSKILVMDQFAKDEMINEGFEAERIAVSGQPYFELINNEVNKMLSGKGMDFRKKLGIEFNERVIVFASECLSDTYGGTENCLEYWGYDEKTVFMDLVEGLTAYLETQNQKFVLVLRQHPKEKSGNFDEILQQIKSRKNDKLRITINNKIDGLVLIDVADCIVGMSSMFLLEACICGKPILSIQTNLKRENPFVLDRKGVIKSVVSKESVKDEIRRIFEDEKLIDLNMKLENIAENVIRMMEDCL